MASDNHDVNSVFGKKTDGNDIRLCSEAADNDISEKDGKYGNVSLTSCNFKILKFENCKFGEIVFSSCKFKELIFENCEIYNLTFDRCKFYLLKLDRVSLDFNVDIQYCEVEERISLEKVLAKGMVDVGYTYGKILIKSVQANNVSVYAEGEEKIKELTLVGNFGGSTFVSVGDNGNSSTSIFENLTILMQDVALRVRRVKVDNLFMSGTVSEKSNIVFDDVESKSITLKQVVAGSPIIFNSVKIISSDSRFEIDSSSLGESRFAFCDFSKASVFYLNNSFVNEIKSSGSRWPLKLSEKSSEKKGDDDIKDDFGVAVKRKASFSQIRNIMAASGERYHESQYRYLELDEQVKENIGLPDKVSLWVSKISSNHGANWVWALVVLLFVNLFLNGFMCLAHGGIRVMHESFLKNYFVILNPLYNSRDLFSGAAENEVVLSMLIFFSRVFTAYMYYQIVKSFRKYG